MPYSSQIKSAQRVAEHGEVFTAEREVKAMCDLVADECNRIDSRFLEPACGEGAFLVEILARKLDVCGQKYGTPILRPNFERASVNSIMSIYGVDLLSDNVEACRQRLFVIWNAAYSYACDPGAEDQCRKVVRYILSQNILCGDALTMKQVNGQPIIFAEWSFLDDIKVKRRDFRLDKLIEANKKQQDNIVPIEDKYVGYDWEKKEFFPKPVKEYPLIDYRRLCEHGHF